MVDEELARKIREELVEEAELSPELIDRIKSIMRLTKDGKVLFLFDRKKVTSGDLILLYLAGKKLANIAGLVDTPSAKLDEISRELGMPKGTIGPRLEELRNAGEVARTERGFYEVTIVGMVNVINRVESRLTEASKLEKDQKTA